MSQIEPRPDELSRINSITEAVIGCAFAVHNALGFGFLERVYENALVHEMRKRGLFVSQQHRLEVRYDEVVVGEYVADALVNGLVVLELKAVRELDSTHAAQAINLVKGTGSSIALLINFGQRVRVRRFLHPRLLEVVRRTMDPTDPPCRESVSSGSQSEVSVFPPDDFEDV